MWMVGFISSGEKKDLAAPFDRLRAIGNAKAAKKFQKQISESAAKFVAL